MKTPRPLTITLAATKLNAIRQRVRKYPWQDLHAPADPSAWQFGTAPAVLQALAAYWVNEYDWSKQEAALNRFAQYQVELPEARLHFLHERGSGAHPTPLLLLHGWPYSFYSFYEVIEPLAHPERFGGNAEDGFDVVVASLPGYTFSDHLTAPMGPKRMGDLCDTLMTEVLGYATYLVQGGDWGGYIASRLGFDHADHVRGIHSNSFMVRHAGALLGNGQTGLPHSSPEETAFVQQEAQVFQQAGGYSIIQATRPVSLSYGMMDSPIGVAAWLLEKFHDWADLRDGELWDVFQRDHFITEVMLYLITHSFDTATWVYSTLYSEGSATLPAGQRVAVPTAFAAYPDPVFRAPPQTFMEHSHHVVQWHQMARGGHFPMLETPDLYINDLRAFAQALAH